MQVRIKIVNRKVLNIVADDETEDLRVNNVPVVTDVKEFVGKMTILTSSWAPRYENPHVIDGEEYAIKFISQDREWAFSGKNKFPVNYDEFKALIDKVVRLCK